MEKTKRARSTNFTANEMEVLLTLVESHKGILECKRTDTVTNGEKEKEWEKLAAKFNASVGTGRTSKHLRSKWDAWKKNTKKEFSAQKNCLYKTGGGPYTDIKLGNWGERVLGIIGLSATGTENIFDSDNVGAVEQANTPCDTDLHLESSIDLSNVDVLLDIGVDEIPEVHTNKENIVPLAQVEEEKAEEPLYSTENSKESNWKHWNPALLRKKVHPALTKKHADEVKIEIQSSPSSRGTFIATPQQPQPHSSRKRKRETETATRPALHELLLQRKLELVELQIQLLKREHEQRERRSEEKHELEMAVLRKELR